MRKTVAEKKKASRAAPKSTEGFSEEERAAMREAVRERKAPALAGSAEAEGEVLAKIAEMKGPDRFMAERFHAIVKASAPSLGARTWYGMPAYARDGQVVCWFQPAGKFKARYGMIGFSDEAKLDEGRMWPISYALTDLTAAEEAKIVALLKKAVN